MVQIGHDGEWFGTASSSALGRHFLQVLLIPASEDETSPALMIMVVMDVEGNKEEQKRVERERAERGVVRESTDRERKENRQVI